MMSLLVRSTAKNVYWSPRSKISGSGVSLFAAHVAPNFIHLDELRGDAVYPLVEQASAFLAYGFKDCQHGRPTDSGQSFYGSDTDTLNHEMHDLNGLVC